MFSWCSPNKAVLLGKEAEWYRNSRAQTRQIRPNSASFFGIFPHTAGKVTFLEAKKEARKRGEPRLLINTTIRRMEESKLMLVKSSNSVSANIVIYQYTVNENLEYF
jgi:hypothetical protein